MEKQDQTTTESNSQVAVNRARRIGAALSVVAMGLLAYGSATNKYPFRVIDNLLYPSCPAVPPEFVDTVRADIQRPQLPFLQQFKEENISHGKQLADLQIPDERVYLFLHRQANVSGLRLTNYLDYWHEINESESINEALSLMNGLTNQYGFMVGIPDKLGSDDEGVDAEVVDKNSIPLDIFKKSAGEFTLALGIMPIEVVRYSQLKEIKLVHLPPGVGGVASPGERIIYWPIHESGTPFPFQLAFYHELGHQLDARFCGLSGMEDDRSFESFNLPDFKYQDIYERFPNPNIWTSAAYNVTEDKAVNYSYLFDGIIGGPKIVRNKTAYLLARLEEHVPGSSDYLTSIDLYETVPSKGG